MTNSLLSEQIRACSPEVATTQFSRTDLLRSSARLLSGNRVIYLHVLSDMAVGIASRYIKDAFTLRNRLPLQEINEISVRPFPPISFQKHALLCVKSPSPTSILLEAIQSPQPTQQPLGGDSNVEEVPRTLCGRIKSKTIQVGKHIRW